MSESWFSQILAQSQKRWKPETDEDKLCQIIGAASGFSTAKVCRRGFGEAARHALTILSSPK